MDTKEGHSRGEREGEGEKGEEASVDAGMEVYGYRCGGMDHWSVARLPCNVSTLQQGSRPNHDCALEDDFTNAGSTAWVRFAWSQTRPWLSPHGMLRTARSNLTLGPLAL